MELCSAFESATMKTDSDANADLQSEFDSTSTSAGNPTPPGSDIDSDIGSDIGSDTDTVMDDHETDHHKAAHRAQTVPWPGNTYIIRDPKSRQQITLVDGELRLDVHLGDQGGYHWQCVEKDGWLGFRSPSDSLHIGHDGNGNFIAQKTHHKDWEYFNTRAHPAGGHLLLMRHWSGQWQMAIGPDGQKLIETKEQGTAWEFEKVGTWKARLSASRPYDG
ncbi:hypothetical protein F5Y05DRAFT_380855 [Hypoxylon sp. FL0543]|nr:hypothetical protein F5Y05DRAFT_380855 [Hypoxylon sp. FL0543]